MAGRVPAAVERAPAPSAAARRVRLGAGQTLYGLAREHLGDGKRWREIATLNGWSDTDIQSLPAGVDVALPAR